MPDHIQDTGEIFFIDLLRGAKPPEQRRRTYTPPTASDIGTIDDLIYLQDIFAQHAPNLFRLALNAEFLTECIKTRADDVRAGWAAEDLASLCTMLRILHGRRKS